MSSSFVVVALALVALVGVSMGMFMPPFYNDNSHHDGRFDEHRHHDFFPRQDRFGPHHPRFRRQYFGGMGGMGGMRGMGGGMGGMRGMGGGFGGMGGGMGGGMNNMQMMAAQMGGQFPGVVQSNQNSWGSFKSERQGGFNNQEQSLIMG